MPTKEDMKTLILNVSKDYKTSKELRAHLGALIQEAGHYYIDHKELPNLNAIISNSQFRLKTMIQQEEQSLLNMLKKLCIVESLRFILPFLLGVLFTVYGVPYMQELQQSAPIQTQLKLPL